MLADERHRRILGMVHERRTCTVEELRQELGVSQVTLYRDLKRLDEQKLIRRVHGGVVLQERPAFESRFSVRLHTETSAKEKIGRLAAKAVEEGWAIFVDQSSTCYLFARELARMQRKRLTLVTNSPQIPIELGDHPHIRVISTGGELIHEQNALAGPLAMELLSRLRFDAAFVSCAGFSPVLGATMESPLLCEVLRQVAANSRHRHLLIDSSKFRRQALLTALRIDEIDRIVTDSDVPREDVQQLEARGLEVTLA